VVRLDYPLLRVTTQVRNGGSLMHNLHMTVCYASIAVVAGCISVAPHEARIVSTIAPETAYRCALGLVDSLGYTLASSDQKSGFLKADRQYNDIFAVHRDQLTVTILKPDSAHTEVHVSGSSEAGNYDTRDVLGPTAPSGQVASDASLVAARCGGNAQS